MAETFIVTITEPCNKRGSYRALRHDPNAFRFNVGNVIVRNLAEIGDAGFRENHLLPNGYVALALWDEEERLEDTPIAYVLEAPELEKSIRTVLASAKPDAEYSSSARTDFLNDLGPRVNKRAITRVSLQMMNLSPHLVKEMTAERWAELLCLPAGVKARLCVCDGDLAILELSGAGLPDYCQLDDPAKLAPIIYIILRFHTTGAITFERFAH
ncbi:MAG TPA: hypothetical protein VK797_22890 [Tepidisphaeraceae bacterium]|jgi:hypothetical protein|nr:hypothetical protein [Tepidisphaeraceae bacterium]